MLLIILNYNALPRGAKLRRLNTMRRASFGMRVCTTLSGREIARRR
ncbi:hypothetical protein CAMRE0001_2242 [Campylobacter rectus RM3267]|uniref:Uncharacterized protein n=1 Tax=Campylobacter rectus RM3267 TaxID=553218 RepID=B9D381_CAMRE|nr:hypothetical protein CAMRE0001_2242 [Campylobacter rectus RM3267]